MDRALSESTKRNQKKKILLRVVIVVVTLTVLVILLRNFIRPQIDSDEFYTSKATIGDIQVTVSASGTVLPEYEEIISSPISSKIKRITKNAGDHITAGDTILLLDKRSASVSSEKMKDELAMKMNNENKLRLQLEQSLIDLRTQTRLKNSRLKIWRQKLRPKSIWSILVAGPKKK